jgi:hypothetical protein
MNLHEQLDTLIAEQQKTNELLAQIAGGAAPAKTAAAGAKTAASKTAASKTAAADKKPEITIQQATDACTALRDAHGTAVVKAIFAKHKVAKMAEMTEAQAPKVYADCLAKQAELDGGAAEEEEDDDI